MNPAILNPMAQNKAYESADFSATLEALKKGEVILYPTDTIWGIGCDATNEEAVKRIFSIKEREDSKSLILLTDSITSLERITGTIPEAAEQLIEAAVKPLTIIYDRAYGVAKECIATDGSIAIRVTRDPFCRQLCRLLKRPIVSTSANVSGSAAPANFAAVSEKIKSRVDYIVNYRQDDSSEHHASEIIKVSNNNTIKIIRG